MGVGVDFGHLTTVLEGDRERSRVGRECWSVYAKVARMVYGTS
jgi:hypothetical protein